MSACSGLWCCSRVDARLVLLVRCCLRCRTAGVVRCWLSVVFASPGLVLYWCVPPPPPVGACCVCACPPPMVGHAALVCGPPHGRACCFGAWPPSWWGVLCWCPSAAVVVRGVVVFGLDCCRLLGCDSGCVVCLVGVGALLVRGPPPVGACPVCVWPPPWWGVLCRLVRVSVCGVVAGSMLSLFCWFSVVSAAVRPALSGVGCLWCLPGRGWCCAGACPPPVGACCVCAWPPPWWGVLCWCVHYP